MKNASITVLFLASAIFGQTINISGTVSNSSAQPISGAVVKLFSAALSCTTKADGTYLLSGSTAVLNGISKASSFGITYKKGLFVVNSAVSSPANISVYDFRGRMVASVFSGLLHQGATTVQLPQERLGHGMLLLRADIGGAIRTYTLSPASAGGFGISGPSFANGKLAKIMATDWLQASKTGYQANVQQISSYTGVVNITLGALTAPNFGPNVSIFDPTMSMSTIQSKMDGINGASGAQFNSNRNAYFFKPGTYTVNISLNFYIQAYGLGLSPEDVQIAGSIQDITGQNQNSFWRGAEGMTTTPTSGSVMWGVSQACPFRRIHVKGKVSICDGGASGGFLSDSKIDGMITSGCAQQFYIRNTVLSGINAGGNWNFMVQGCDNPPTETWPTGGISVVAKTPLVREKPYITFDATSNAYSVFVPALRTNSQGITWGNGAPAGDLLPIDQFYIAIAGTDNATTINAALASGKNLILTPGTYLISTPILVQRPGTVVLGLGMATLQAQNGTTCLKTADADGITIANLLVEAGSGGDSPVLFQVGDAGSAADHSANPPFVFDLFIRAGGSVAGTSKIGAIFNSNNTVLDHCWIWRADHGAGAGWLSDTTTVRNGIVINGNNCITYAQMVEHWQKYNTIWNGNNGQQYFYQNEISYNVPNQASFMEGSTLGIPSIKVTDGVTKFYGWGLGVYSNFQTSGLVETNAIETPKVPGCEVHRVVTFSLGDDKGTILHAVNDTGAAAKQIGGTAMIRFGDYVGH
jgi:hypothetical protein